MKKQIIYLFVIAAVLLGVLSGCYAPATGGDSSETASVDSFESSADGDSSIDEVVQPEETSDSVADFLAAHGQASPEKAPNIPAAFSPTETPCLYSLTLSDIKGSGYTALQSGDNIYISTWDYEGYGDGTDVIYSLQTGEALNIDLGLASWGNMGTLEDSGFWFFDIENGTVFFVDKYGAKTTAYTVPESGTGINISVSADGEYILVAYSDGSHVQTVDVKSGTVADADISIDEYIWSIDYSGDRFVLSFGDNEYAFIDPKSGSCITKTTDMYGSFCGELFSYSVDDAVLLGDPDEEQRLFIPLENGESVMSVASGYLTTSCSDGSFGFYDLGNGLRANVTMPDVDLYNGVTALNENGTALITALGNDALTLYMYDVVSAFAGVADIESAEVRLCSGDFISEDIKALAAEIENDFGVELIYGSAGNDFIDYSYVSQAVTDPFRIYSAMRTMKSVFALYPSGMLREAYEFGYDGIQIYLCGNIYGIGGGLSAAGAFVTESGKYIVMVLDIYEDLYYNLPHELSHVFDRRIEYVSENGGTDLLAEWEAATPLTGAYGYSYDGYDGMSAYTVDGEVTPSRVWFLDAYSRTYPTEDRARIMETLFNRDDYRYPAINDYENIKQKASLYCRILRTAFPCCDIDGALYWEEGLSDTAK